MKAFGSHSGQHYLMRRNRVEYLSDALKKDARKDVPVQRQAYPVLSSAPARMTVKMHDCYSSFNRLLFFIILKKINRVTVIYISKIYN